MSSKPSSTLQRCRGTVRRICSRKSDDNVIKVLTTLIKALHKKLHIDLDSKQPSLNFDPIVHNIDLGLDDDLYVLANATLELARLQDKRGDLATSEKMLSDCLCLFPRFIAALSSRAQVKRQQACCESDLVEVEGLLREAVLAGKELEEAEGGLVVSSNRECEKEVEAAIGAQSALAMLLCQAGRDKEAAEHLVALDFTHRLSPKILHYAPSPADTPPPSPSSDWLQYTAAFDSALPTALLSHLQKAFSIDSPFWSEHNYGRIGYFSYMHPLDPPGTGTIPQLAQHLQALFLPLFPRLSKAKYVEWWAHCRPHCSGHQLHFDSDDEGQGGVRNPIISTVIFLTGGVGGPTLVTNQGLGESLGDRGWLIHPKENRVAAFDGRFLHGVVPGRGPAPAASARRCTLMLAFWEHIECRSDPQGGSGPSRVFPHPCPEHLTWPTLLEVGREGGWGGSSPTLVAPAPVSDVWVPVKEQQGNPGPVPTYDACFQGF